MQIRDSYCEISIRCPYCSNLMASFGLNGFNYDNEKRLPDLDWVNIIYKVRNEWKKDRKSAEKKIFEYALERTIKLMKAKVISEASLKNPAIENR